MLPTPKQKYLKPHTIFGEGSFDEYCLRISEFYFRKEVPEDVIKNFEVIEKLMALSYYEYKFIDEAYFKALRTFEMAIRIRYKELTQQTKSIELYRLINKLSELNLFETDIQVLNHFRNLRNLYSHSDRHSFAGIVLWNRPAYLARLINEMYEDVNLRLERKDLLEQFSTQLQNNNLENGLVMEINGELTILFSLELLFVNNKNTPHTYLFGCVPLFNLESEHKGNIQVPFIFKAKLVAPTITNSVLQGISFTAKQAVSFRPISDYPDLLLIYGEWKRLYDTNENKMIYEIAIDFSKIYHNEIKEFERM